MAQIIAGSALWNVTADPQKTANERIAESLVKSPAQDRFHEQRKIARNLLCMEESPDDTLVYRKDDWDKSHDLHAVFAQLLSMDDKAVMEVLTFVVAETLPSGDAIVEVLGKLMGVEMSAFWSPDEVFLELMRDKEAINAILKDVAGKSVAEGNITATAKVQKQIIRDCLDGTRQPAKPDWQPRYMSFPMTDYTKRGGIRAVDEWKAVKKHYA